MAVLIENLKTAGGPARGETDLCSNSRREGEQYLAPESVAAFDPVPVEPRGVDSLVARLLLDTLDGLKRGDLKSTNSTDWVAVWRGIAASPGSEWGLTKRAVALIAIAAQGKERVDRGNYTVDGPAPQAMRLPRRKLNYEISFYIFSFFLSAFSLVPASLVSSADEGVLREMFLVGGGVGWQRRGFAKGWMNDSVAVCGGWEGVDCDEDGRVTEMGMDGWGVTALPTGIGSLSGLSYWYGLYLYLSMYLSQLFPRRSLSNNQLQTIPESIGNLTKLQWLYFFSFPSLLFHFFSFFR